MEQKGLQGFDHFLGIELGTLTSVALGEAIVMVAQLRYANFRANWTWVQHILNNSRQFAPGVGIALYPFALHHILGIEIHDRK